MNRANGNGFLHKWNILVLLGNLLMAVSVFMPFYVLKTSIAYMSEDTVYSLYEFMEVSGNLSMLVYGIWLICVLAVVFMFMGKPALSAAGDAVGIVLIIYAATRQVTSGNSAVDEVFGEANSWLLENAGSGFQLSHGAGLYIYIIGAGIAIGGAVLFLKGRNGQEIGMNAAASRNPIPKMRPEPLKRNTVAQSAPMAQMPAQAAQQSEAAPYAESLAEQHHGERVRLKGRKILIGRDSSADIIFKEGTPGVSGQHCTLSYDAQMGKFVLTDLNSTYGTFLADGKRLQSEVPYALKPGDNFYVGDRANPIQVGL